MNCVRYPYVPPQGGTKRNFAIFFSKFRLLSKKVCCTVSSCENFQRQSCSYIDLMVQRWIAGDVPIYQKFALKVTHPLSENADFDRFRFIVPQPWELAKKNQLSLIGSRQRAFHRAIDKQCTVPLSPSRGGSKRNFLHLAWPFISLLQVIVNISDLIRGLNIASLSLQLTNRPWNGRGHVKLPNF